MDEQDNDADQTTEGGLPGIRVGSRWEVSCPFNYDLLRKKTSAELVKNYGPSQSERSIRCLFDWARLS